MKWSLAIALAACGDNRALPDAAIAIDAPRVDAPPACEVFELASCEGSTARLTLESFDGCAAPMTREVTCATTCAIDFARVNLGRRAVFSLDPVVFCAETPVMFAGAACGPTLCLPTRAVLANDGTVASQLYIACGEEFCIPRIPPVIAGYGSPCTPSAYDERDPDRSACFAGGSTEICIGDWECPAQMLCDDQVADRPVCKPGPRG